VLYSRIPGTCATKFPFFGFSFVKFTSVFGEKTSELGGTGTTTTRQRKSRNVFLSNRLSAGGAGGHEGKWATPRTADYARATAAATLVRRRAVCRHSSARASYRLSSSSSLPRDRGVCGGPRHRAIRFLPANRLKPLSVYTFGFSSRQTRRRIKAAVMSSPKSSGRKQSFSHQRSSNEDIYLQQDEYDTPVSRSSWTTNNGRSGKPAGVVVEKRSYLPST